MEEYPIDLIALTVAQQYSILVTARNDTCSNWAIHANMDTDMFNVVPPTLNPSPSFPAVSQILPDLRTDVTSTVTYNASAPLTNNGFVDDTALAPTRLG